MRHILYVVLLWHATGSAANVINCQALDGRLNEMASADQQVRMENAEQQKNPGVTRAEQDELQRRWTAVDMANTTELKELLAACGWPSGKTGSHSAWLLVQHADRDREFQRQARDLLEAAVRRGEAAPRDLAYLSDRIAAAEGRPQEYGTQFTKSDRCTLTLNPVDSTEAVNRRRLAVGLQSIEEYEAEGRKRFIPADCGATQPPETIK